MKFVWLTINATHENFNVFIIYLSAVLVRRDQADFMLRRACWVIFRTRPVGSL